MKTITIIITIIVTSVVSVALSAHASFFINGRVVPTVNSTPSTQVSPSVRRDAPVLTVEQRLNALEVRVNKLENK